MVERILDLMARDGVNGIELAAAVGVPKNAVSEWKSGKAKPGTEAVVKIATYFGVSTDYLLKGSEPQRRLAKEESYMNEMISADFVHQAMEPVFEIFKELGVTSVKEMSDKRFGELSSLGKCPTLLDALQILDELKRSNIVDTAVPTAFAQLFLKLYGINSELKKVMSQGLVEVNTPAG